MNDARVIYISDIERNHRGLTLGDELSVFHGSGISQIFGYEARSSFYFRAFAYMLILHGHTTIKIDQRPYDVHQGTLLSQSSMHLVQFLHVSPDFEFKVMAVTLPMIDRLRNLNIRPRIAEGVRTHLQPITPLTAPESQLIEHALDDIGNAIARPNHHFHLELVQNSLCRFFLEYDNIFASRPDNPDSSLLNPRRQQLVDHFINLVSNSLHLHTDINFYCDKMGITPQYLNRVMTSQTGMRPSDFIREMLYAEARNLLASPTLSIQDVAARLGFADQSSFGKFFKRCAGITPSQFTKKTNP